MKLLDIVIRPRDAALAIGGMSSPQHGGHRATARTGDGRLTIPATALRGALRIELERLLSGRDEAVEACSANRGNASPEKACPCPVCRLFGESGTASGSLRLEDATVHGRGSEGISLRPQVSVSRRTGSAAEGHLLISETSPVLGVSDLTFRSRAFLLVRGAADPEAEMAEDLTNLRAACRAIQALGGGKAGGLGWVECEVVEKDAGQSPTAPELRTSALGLTFEAKAPLHFGSGPPMGFFHPTRRDAPGSTVRGALAFALLEQGLAEPEDTGFQTLFGEDAEARFGSARLEGERPSATRRTCRPEEHVFDDLVAEVIRRAAAKRRASLAIRPNAICPQPNCAAVKTTPWTSAAAALRPRLAVRTRTALNRKTGTAMDAKLYAQEVLEPMAGDSRDPSRERPLRLRAEVRGLTAAGRQTLARLHGREVWLGGKRSKGMGRCRLEIEELQAARNGGADKARRAAEDLAAALEAAWRALRTAAPELDESLLEASELPLALVLDEPWCPRQEPVAESLEAGPLSTLPGAEPARLLASFVRYVELGRFGAVEARRHYGASRSVLCGESVRRVAAKAGTTYVYAVPVSALDEHLESWLRAGHLGIGERCELGWGRFTVRGPDPKF